MSYSLEIKAVVAANFLLFTILVSFQISSACTGWMQQQPQPSSSKASRTGPIFLDHVGIPAVKLPIIQFTVGHLSFMVLHLAITGSRCPAGHLLRVATHECLPACAVHPAGGRQQPHLSTTGKQETSLISVRLQIYI